MALDAGPVLIDETMEEGRPPLVRASPLSLEQPAPKRVRRGGTQDLEDDAQREEALAETLKNLLEGGLEKCLPCDFCPTVSSVLCEAIDHFWSQCGRQDCVICDELVIKESSVKRLIFAAAIFHYPSFLAKKRLLAPTCPDGR